MHEVKSNAAILIMESSCGTCGAEGVFVLADSGHGIDGNNQAQTEIHKQGIRNTEYGMRDKQDRRLPVTT